MRIGAIDPEDRETYIISEEIRFYPTHRVGDMLYGRLYNSEVYAKSTFSKEILTDINKELVKTCEEILEDIKQQLKTS